MPALENDFREDVEILLKDMEGLQASDTFLIAEQSLTHPKMWLTNAEEVLASRKVQGNLADSIKENVAVVSGQLTEARQKVLEWQEGDRLKAQAEHRKGEDDEVNDSATITTRSGKIGTRSLGKRKADAIDLEGGASSTTPPKQIRKRVALGGTGALAAPAEDAHPLPATVYREEFALGE